MPQAAFLLSISAPGGSAPVARFAAGLLAQLQALDRDALVERLRHVVDRERGQRGARQGLHLDARLAGGARPAAHLEQVLVARHDLELDVLERQRMAERDELARALGREEPGAARDLRDRSLRPRSAPGHVAHPGREAHLSTRGRAAPPRFLFTHVYHARALAIGPGLDVAEPASGSAGAGGTVDHGEGENGLVWTPASSRGSRKGQRSRGRGDDRARIRYYTTPEPRSGQPHATRHQLSTALATPYPPHDRALPRRTPRLPIPHREPGHPAAGHPDRPGRERGRLRRPEGASRAMEARGRAASGRAAG